MSFYQGSSTRGRWEDGSVSNVLTVEAWSAWFSFLKATILNRVQGSYESEVDTHRYKVDSELRASKRKEEYPT